MSAKPVLKLADDLPEADLDEGELGQLDATLADRRADHQRLSARLQGIEQEALAAGRAGSLGRLDEASKARLLASGGLTVLAGVIKTMEAERDVVASRVETRRREEARRQRLEGNIPERAKAEGEYVAATASAEAAFEAPMRELLNLRAARRRLAALNLEISQDGGPGPAVPVVDEGEFLRLRRLDVLNKYCGRGRFEIALPPADV